MTNETRPTDLPPPAGGGQVERSVRPWGWHAGDGTLPEPLFLLHTGALYGGERDDWDVQANSGRAVDALADEHPGVTLGMYDEHTVRGLLAAERERWQHAAEVMAQEAERKFPMDGTLAHWLRSLAPKRGA